MDPGKEADLFAFLSEESEPPRKPRLGRWLLFAALGVLALLGAAAVVVPGLLIADRRADLMAGLDRRLSILADGRAEVLGAWLEGNAQLAARVGESELFRLFATELAMAGGDLSEIAPRNPEDTADPEASGGVDPLVLQLPYMEQLLNDFARDTSFLAAYLIGPKGDIQISSAGAPALAPALAERARALFAEGAVWYGPARLAAAGLVSDILLPVFPVQVETGEGRPVAVLLLSAPVGARLAELLSPPALSEPGERLHLIQETADGLAEVRPGAAPPIRPLDGVGLFDDGAIPFAERPALGGGERSYSAGAPVPGSPWWILQEVDVRAAEADFDAFRRWVVAVAILLLLSVAIALAAFWWRLAEGHSRALAEQYHRLAARIERQRRLLDSINGAIADHIGLKGLDGAYRYVNAAFARALNRPAEQIVGQDDAAVFGQGTADLLKVSDTQALEDGGPVTGDYEIFAGRRQRHLQISKAPFPDESGAPSGIVSVARDVTELVEAQKKRERAVAQTVTALVRAVELRDPYLAGHSKRVAEFAVETARRLGADAEECATVETAANLSQIGKLAIPRALLNKAERLDEDEVAQMQTHVAHAERVLKGIEFELPVARTLRQMHERLDGTGYPDGLSGKAISRPARILGACDVFCARVEPRSYRQGIPPAEALAVLEQNRHRYDPDVVAALRAAVQSVTGEKLIVGIDAA